MNTSECDKLDDYLDGSLADDEQAEFEAHLAGCPACREEIDAQRQINRLLVQATGRLETVPPTLTHRIDEQIRLLRGRRAVRLAWSVLAAAAVLLAFTVWFTTRDSGPSSQPRPIAAKQRESATGQKQTVRPAHPVTDAKRLVQVAPADPSEAIVVPVETKAPNVTMVWIYPTVKPAQAAGPPDCKIP